MPAGRIHAVKKPTPFGKYYLLERINVGGMAEVFRAKAFGVEGFERLVAVKRILPNIAEDKEFIRMFIEEAKLAVQLNHANIAQIFDLGVVDGAYYIALEHVHGRDLRGTFDRCRSLGEPMPVAQACFIVMKLCEGLDYAHNKRDQAGRELHLVHRDVSPQNVLVSFEGEVKVIDFGIAKAANKGNKTQAGILKGKFGYMSPEQVRGIPIDRRSDVFSCGIVLYELLTGERLFVGESDFSTLEKVRNVDIQPPRALNPAIPEAVERVILKALAKDVDDRYQWCSEMLGDLQQYLMGQDVVFTAKTLSSWLKEIFAQEIDRERQLLEQYKRVGRDGLIGGLPSAEADRNVVSALGEAGAPEGDATTLGGPNFDDIEQAAGAAPEVGPAPGSPATRPATDTDARPAGDSDPGDFGEEAPTEIFGDSLDTNLPMPQPRAPQPTPSRAPVRATTQRPAELGAAPSSRPATSPPPPQPPTPSAPPPQQMIYGQASPPAGVPQQYPANPAYGYASSMGSDPATTTPPGAFSAQSIGTKTVLGLQAPLPPNGQAPYHPTGPQQALPTNPYPYPQQYPSRPSMPQVQPPNPNQSPNQYGAQPYGYPGGMQVTPVDGLQPSVEGKRSTLVRDIGIGVAIAVLVLGGFFLI